MARAAQHVPEMTLVNWPPSMRSVVTMPDRKWKGDNVRLGGIQGGTQTDQRTRQLNPHPHPHPQALELAMAHADAPALTPCPFVWLICVISSTIFCT